MTENMPNPATNTNTENRPVGVSVGERLYTDLKRTSGADGEQTLEARLGQYGVAQSALSIFGQEREQLDQALTREPNPKKRDLMEIAGKFAVNLGAFGAGLLAGTDALNLSVPGIGIGIRAVASGAGAAIDWNRNANIDKSAQFYENKVASTEGSKASIWDKIRGFINGFEKGAIEKIFGVKNRDTVILGVLNNGIQPDDERFIKITDEGVVNKQLLFTRLKEIAGTNEAVNSEGAKEKLKVSGALTKLLLTQSLLSGFSEHSNPKKIAAFADISALAALVYKEAITKHAGLVDNTEILSLDNLWIQTQKDVQKHLTSAKSTWTYILSSAAAGALKSLVFSGIGYALGAAFKAFTETGVVGELTKQASEYTPDIPKYNPLYYNEQTGVPLNETLTGDTHEDTSRAIMEAMGIKPDTAPGLDLDVDSNGTGISDFDSEAMNVFDKSSDELNAYLAESPERIDRFDFIKTVAEIHPDNIDSTLLDNNSDVQELVKSIKEVTGQSDEEILRLLKEGALNRNLGKIAEELGISRSDLIQRLVLRGGVSTGPYSGTNILARIITGKLNEGDISSLSAMSQYTSNVHNGWYELMNNALGDSPLNTGSVLGGNSGDLNLLTELNNTSLEQLSQYDEGYGMLEQVVSDNEIYAGLLPHHTREELISSLMQYTHDVERLQDLDSETLYQYLGAEPERVFHFDIVNTVDIIRNESASRYYYEMVGQLMKQTGKTLPELYEIFGSSNVNIDVDTLAMNYEDLGTLRSAVQVRYLVDSIALESGQSYSQVLDQLARDSHLIDSLQQGATTYNTDQETMIRGIIGLGKSAGLEDNEALRVLSTILSRDFDATENAEISELIKTGSANYDNAGWKVEYTRFFNKVFNQQGCELPTIQEIGVLEKGKPFNSAKEYYDYFNDAQVNIQGGGNAPLAPILLGNLWSWSIGTLGSLGGAILASTPRGTAPIPLTMTNSVTNTTNPANDDNTTTTNNIERITNEERDFKDVSAHKLYRLGMDTRLGKSILTTKEKVSQLLTQTERTVNIEEIPSLSSIFGVLEQEIRTVSPIESSRNLEKLLGSEAGIFIAMQSIAAMFKIRGQDIKARNLISWHDLLLENDRTISSHTVRYLQELKDKSMNAEVNEENKELNTYATIYQIISAEGTVPEEVKKELLTLLYNNKYFKSIIN